MWPGTLAGAEKGDADPTGKRAREKGEENQSVEEGKYQGPKVDLSMIEKR